MKVLDDKDLEIARLTGKVEALESELAKERAARMIAAPPPPPQTTRTVTCMHASRDLNDRCLACGEVVVRGVTNSPWQIWPSDITYQHFNPACQGGLAQGTVWMTTTFPPPGTVWMHFDGRRVPGAAS